MADTLGEDRLLDKVEAALQAATPGPWANLNDRIGVFSVAQFHPADAHLISQAHDWLARLCARVRHLKAEVEHEHSNATAILRKYEEAIADADRAEAASQRLTEALRKEIARLKESALRKDSELNVPIAVTGRDATFCSKGEANGLYQAAIEFENVLNGFRKLVGAGAPPEGEK